MHWHNNDNILFPNKKAWLIEKAVHTVVDKKYLVFSAVAVATMNYYVFFTLASCISFCPDVYHCGYKHLAPSTEELFVNFEALMLVLNHFSVKVFLRSDYLLTLCVYLCLHLRAAIEETYSKSMSKLAKIASNGSPLG